MGWLQKAVSFLKSTQSGQEALSISQLQDWLQQRSQEIVENNSLLSLAREHAKLLEDKRWALEARLDVWQKKTRLHPGAAEIIPLFRETRQILDGLHFPVLPAIGEVLAVNQELEKKLHDLMGKIETESFIHDSGFLGDEASSETNPLLLALLDLDAARKNFEQVITQSNYHTIHLICSKVEFMRKVSVHLQQLNTDVDGKKSRLSAANKKKKEKEQSLQQLRGDTKNNNLDQLAQRKKELEKKLEEKETEVLSFFSRIKPLLLQYREIEPSNGLLFSYLEDPLSSFFQDEGLFIVEVLEKIAELLRQGKFSLNQEALVSSLSALEGIYNQHLYSIKIECKEAQKELGELSEQMSRSLFAIKVDDAAYRLEHYGKQTQKLEEEIAALTQKASKVQELLNREQQEVQSLIKTSLQREVSVIVN